MRGTKVKKIRKQFRKEGVFISAEPYRAIGRTVVSQPGRRRYQKVKEAMR
jgi:hypothetical protein